MRLLWSAFHSNLKALNKYLSKALMIFYCALLSAKLLQTISLQSFAISSLTVASTIPHHGFIPGLTTISFTIRAGLLPSCTIFSQAFIISFTVYSSPPFQI